MSPGSDGSVSVSGSEGVGYLKTTPTDAELAAFQSQQAALRDICVKHGLDKGSKADAIAELLDNAQVREKMSATEFAAKFGLSEQEAQTFLDVVKAGILFKEKHLTFAMT